MYKGRDFFDLIIKWYQTGNQEEYPGRIWKKIGVNKNGFLCLFV